MSSTTRRGALLGSALAGLISAPAVTKAQVAPSFVNPDAELIALCAEFHRQNQVVLGVECNDDDGMDVAILARWDISNKIEDIAPVTPTGCQAKAGVALFLLEENYGPAGCREGSSMRFAVAALRDIAGSDAA